MLTVLAVIAIAAAVAVLWIRSKQRKCGLLARRLGIRPSDIPFPMGVRTEFSAKYQRKVDGLLVRLGAEVAQARINLAAFDRLALRDMKWDEEEGDRLDQSLELAERELRDFFRLAGEFGFEMPADADLRKWEAYVPPAPGPTAA